MNGIAPREDSLVMIRLRMLGPTTADVDGVPVDLGGPLQRAVLTLLAL
jgi:DNA-binding SARP family transcriptional activator